MSKPGYIPHLLCHTTDYSVKVPRERDLRGAGGMWKGNRANVGWNAVLSQVGELG